MKNKRLFSVKAMLDDNKKSISQKLLQASLTPEQKTKLEETMSKIEAAISELEAADTEASNEQLAEVFTKAIEALTAVTDQSVKELEASIQSKMIELQAKIQAQPARAEKFSAKLSLAKLRESRENVDGFKPFHAGVDVSAWTPEAEIEDVEIYHPLIGVTQGFNVGTTAKTSIKLRTMSTTGNAAVVLNHGVKPLIELVGAQNVVNVATYAGIVEGIADEDLEDNPGLEAEIQQEALDNLGQTENTAAIALLTGVAQTYSNANFGTKANADEKTALVAVIDQVRQALGNRQSEICFAANSSQWAKLKDLRNSNGTPIDIQSVIGDVIQIVDNSLSNDNFLCWAKKFANIKVYKGKTPEWYKGVKSTVVDGKVTSVYSEWRTDESSLRVRQRQVLYVSDDTTVVKGTISGVKTAVTEVVG